MNLLLILGVIAAAGLAFFFLLAVGTILGMFWPLDDEPDEPRRPR